MEFMIVLSHIAAISLSVWVTHEVLDSKHRRELWKVQMKLLEVKRERDLGILNRIREASKEWN